ncbi:MAG: hypothetical protein ACRDT2_03385 [Natronosporangium sp.]
MSRNLHVVFAPDQWRGDGPPGDLAIQIMHDRITAVPDDPGWAQVEGWRYYPDDPGPHRVVVQVRAEVIPAGLRPEGTR